ncbi:lysine-rich arabinogalactan protein 19-like protein [Carex littledalei]|uniref:Lysine-rich arabinogalactan protein 19-like protein n=1 Tax=Carex littledalei TaxID=544730 RepID=A0A833VWL0_9POAL|nr:lysine-rich arabinogalactan protein 19-like protein [Carex littledalei]
MARNHSPNLILNLTLTLTLFLLHLPSLAFSPSPSPSPSPTPRNFKSHSSTVNPVNHPPPSSQGTSIDRALPAARIQHDKERNKRKLNFGEKVGVWFAIVAGAMQFVFVGFLAIKRWQLGRTERGFRERDRDSHVV